MDAAGYGSKFQGLDFLSLGYSHRGAHLPAGVNEPFSCFRQYKDWTWPMLADEFALAFEPEEEEDDSLISLQASFTLVMHSHPEVDHPARISPPR